MIVQTGLKQKAWKKKKKDLMVSLLTCLALANVCEALQNSSREAKAQIWKGEVMLMREELKLSLQILNTSFQLQLLLWGWGFHCSDVLGGQGQLQRKPWGCFCSNEPWILQQGVGVVGYSFHSLTIYIFANRGSVTSGSSSFPKLPCDSFLEVKQEDLGTHFPTFCLP